MPILFSLMWILMMVVIITSLFRSFQEWNKNNHSPKLRVDARVVEKRDYVYRRRSGNHTSFRTSTRYYATFQFDTGDRLELEIPAGQAGLMVEGDKGALTFQGTRFLSFERNL